MTDNFEEMINEDLRSALKDWSSKKVATFRRVRENSWLSFRSFLGNANAAGKLDINKLEEQLYLMFSTFIGRMKYEVTVRAFLDFVQVLKGEESIPLDQLIKALKGTPDLKVASNNSKLIKTIFTKIIADKFDDAKLERAIKRLVELGGDDKNDRRLIFEHMRFISQKRPALLNEPAFEKLVPFLDRYLDPSEVKTMMLNLATTMMRSKVVQEITGGEPAGPSSSGSDGKETDRESTTSDAEDNLGKAVAGRKGEHTIPKMEYMENLEKLHFRDAEHKQYRERTDEEFWKMDSVVSRIDSLHADPDKINAISANVISMFVAYTRPQENQFAAYLHKGAKEISLLRVDVQFLTSLRKSILQGATPEEITQEFIARFDTKTLAARWLYTILRVENAVWQAKHGKKNADN